MASTKGRKEGSPADSRPDPVPADEALPLPPARGLVLLPALLLLILPTGWVQQDDTLDLFLALGLVAGLALLLLWRSPAGGGGIRLPLFALPPLVLGLHLLGLALFGLSGYQPQASLFRLFIMGAVLILAYHAFARTHPGNLLMALRWLVLLMALAYFPFSHWELFARLAGDRYRFTFAHPNALGCFLVLSFPFLLAHPWLAGQEKRDRLLGVLTIAAAFFVAGATESRMALLLMSAQALVLLPWLAHTRGALPWKVALPATVAAVAIFVAAALLVFGKDWMLTKFSRLSAGENSGRIYMWRAVGDLITDHVGRGLVGHGPGVLYQESWNFPLAKYEYFGRAKADAFAHNQILDWTLEGGLLGLVAYGIFAVLLLVPLLRSLSQPSPPDQRVLRGALVLSALAVLAFAQVSITSRFALVVTLTSIVLGGMTRMVGATPASLLLPRGGLPLLALLAAVCFAAQFPRVMSDYHLARATRLLESSEVSRQASVHLRKSLEWDEANVHAWYLRLLTSHNRGNHQAVEEAYGEIEKRVPNLMATRLVYAASLANQGKLAEALPVLDGYLEVNAYDFPTNCQFLTYAHYLGKPGEIDRALERLLRTHIGAISAKGGKAPAFEVSKGEDGQVVWTIAWETRKPVPVPLAEARERPFRGLKGSLGHDLPVVIGNTRRLMGKFGFDRNTLEKAALAE